MPKYSKACHNRHFHEKWGSDSVEVYIVNLRRSGLSELAKTFVNFLKQELDIKSPTVTHVCSNCLLRCLQKRIFTRYLTTGNNKMIENKVSSCVCEGVSL